MSEEKKTTITLQKPSHNVTDWFPLKISPVRNGHYEVKNKSGTIMAYFCSTYVNGEFLGNFWVGLLDEPIEWRGIKKE